MKNSVIIVAGGVGSRFGSSIPKQYISINHKMILEYTVERFLPFVDIVVIVLSSEYLEMCQQKLNFQDKIHFCLGGQSRQESVYNGLCYLSKHQPSLVAIHDAARPIVSENMIQQGFGTANKFGSAIPVVPVTDSLWIRKNQQQLLDSCDRSQYVYSQTPQVFFFSDIFLAHQFQKDKLSFFSDCASVYKTKFPSIYTYEGEKTNIKLTEEKDLEFIKFLLNNKS